MEDRLEVQAYQNPEVAEEDLNHLEEEVANQSQEAEAVVEVDPYLEAAYSYLEEEVRLVWVAHHLPHLTTMNLEVAEVRRMGLLLEVLVEEGYPFLVEEVVVVAA